MKQREVNIIKSVCACVCVVVVFLRGGTSYCVFYMEQKEVNIIKSVCVCALFFFAEEPLMVFFTWKLKGKPSFLGSPEK